jgi:hypothetical protein
MFSKDGAFSTSSGVIPVRALVACGIERLGLIRFGFISASRVKVVIG